LRFWNDWKIFSQYAASGLSRVEPSADAGVCAMRLSSSSGTLFS